MTSLTQLYILVILSDFSLFIYYYAFVSADANVRLRCYKGISIV